MTIIQRALRVAYASLSMSSAAAADESATASIACFAILRAGFVITPFVVFPTGATPRRNPDEVHSVHLVPVRRLLDPDIPRWRPQADGPSLLQLPLRHDMVVHAPTGALLYQFREVALLGRHTRVRDLVEPPFVRS